MNAEAATKYERDEEKRRTEKNTTTQKEKRVKKIRREKNEEKVKLINPQPLNKLVWNSTTCHQNC